MIYLRKSWKRIYERAELENVRLYDVRHTAASIAVGRGASLPIIARLLWVLPAYRNIARDRHKTGKTAVRR